MLPARVTGTLLAGVSGAAFGAMPVLAKVAYADGASVVGLLSVRFPLAALALLALGRLRREAWPPREALRALALLGALGYAVQSGCYFAALERIGAGLTALLLYLFPVLVVVLSAVLQRRAPRPASVACVLVATTGCVLTIGPVGAAQATGVLLGLASAAAYAVYIVGSGTVATGGSPFTSAGVVMGACAVVYDVLVLVRGGELPDGAAGWLALLAVALGCTVVAVSTFFAALVLLGAADTAVVSTVEPLVSVALAAALLGERLGPLQAAGGALVLAAVLVLARLRPVPAVRDEAAVPE